MKKIYSQIRLRAITSISALLLFSAGSFAQYCIPTYITGTVEGDYIGYVGLSGIANTTDGAPSPFYTDYTDMSADLSIGGTYTITLGCGTYTSNNDLAAWIDYNNDGDFSDAGELIGTVLDLTAGATGTATFTVPFDASAGTLTMRVREIYNMPVPPDPCAEYSYGETEDYGVEMGGGTTNDVGVIDITSPSTAAALGFENVIVTVKNFGSAEASEFSVYYQVDGGITTGGLFLGTIPPYGTASYTMPEGYDFSADGCYDITSWTEMEADENTANDSYTEEVCNLLPITGTGAMYIYSNVFGIEPWGSTTNTEAMNQTFGLEGTGWTRDYFESVDVASAFGPDNCFIFLEGSDFMADELESFLAANSATIEGWVAAGGKLLLNAAPNEGDGMSFGFGGTSLIYAYFTANAVAADAGHPIFNGPFLPAGTTYTGTSFGHARITGEGLTDVILDSDFPENVVVAEKAWGDGWVMFGGMTTTNWHDPDPNALNLRSNMFAYLGCSLVDICDMATGMFVDGITDNDAVLHWSAVDGADQYRINLWNTATGVIGKKTVTTTSYSLTDKLAPLTTYAFRLRTICYDEGNKSNWTEWYYWTTLGRIGDLTSTVALYPNPNNGAFTLQVDGYENNTFDLVVLDALGQIVYSKTITIDNNNFTEYISLDNVAGGMYQVRLTNSEHQISYPVMIQR